MTLTLYGFLLCAGYALAHAVLVLRKRRFKAAALDGAFIVAFLLVYALWSDTLPEGWLRLCLLWAPILFFWWAYAWAGMTLDAIHPVGHSFDSALLEFESKWFGQPALHWARRGNTLLCEIAHLGYATYYLYTPAIGAALHLQGRFRDFEQMSFAILFGYLLAYAGFALFPVHGPRWALVVSGDLKPEEQRLAGGPVTALFRPIMWGGAAHRGGAMPSSHTSTGVVFVYWCGWIWGLIGFVLAAAAFLLMIYGAIYGRYHYATDILAGAVLGAGAIALAHVVFGFA